MLTPEEEKEEEDAPFGTGRGSLEKRVTTGLSPPPVIRAPQVWDVSEVDLAKVFPRVASHRVRMRAGPDDEILGSVMFPAVPVPPSSRRRESEQEDPLGEDKTVKQVLISILADV